MTNENIIKEVCMNVMNIQKSDIHVENRLMGGMSNYTYVISIKDKKYTFRIPGKKADKFVDRIVEKHHINLIKPLNLNNNTVFLDVLSGYKIAEYIEGTPLSELDPLDYLKEAANILHSIHESGLKSNHDYDLFGRLTKYENHLHEFDYKHIDRYHELKKRFINFSETYLDPKRYTLTHGDSQVSNFVVTNDKTLKLMDWEFTGNNDPYYDIACFGNSNFDHALALLPVYLDHEPALEDFNRLYFFRAFQCLQWHNVALYKEFIGLSVDLGVDFKKIAGIYLDKAERFLNNIK